MLNTGNQSTPNPSVPYSAWNRLETRPRKKSFERVLRAEIHDPLWMLGRQWQMGEFKGADTGSGILARVQMDYKMISGSLQIGENAVPYSQEIPLEPIVEQVHYKLSVKEQIIAGKKWLFFMKQSLSIANYNTYKALFENSSNGFIINFVEPELGMTDEEIINGASIYSNRELKIFLKSLSLSGLKINGSAVYAVINNNSWATDLNAVFTSISVPTITSQLQVARDKFKSWFLELYPFQPAVTEECWDGNYLEYQFQSYYPDTTSSEFELTAKNYHQGHFDWNAFVQSTDPSSASDVNSTELQIIMAKGKFAGMPSSRWWEFENGGVNFCLNEGNVSDISKVIMTQFALVYQDDWFVVPYTAPVGSYSYVRGIVVSDVFGVTSFIANYDIDDYNTSGFLEYTEQWKDWRWMDISRQQINPSEPATTSVSYMSPSGSMLMLPTVKEVMESKPLESVLFIRDEMSDLVWGIEKVVPDNMGRGVDGSERANSFLEFLKKIKDEEGPVTPTVEPESDAKISYQLQSAAIPENWIPFQPVHFSGNRSIKLQRSSMPRTLSKYELSVVRPLTSILRYGLDGTYEPYYIFEEQVSKAGAIVETSFQRARWYNGKTILWTGRKKKTGRGSGLSGLGYDKINSLE